MKISEIAEVLGCQTHSDMNNQIQWLLTDSRLLAFPDETLFFALITARNDGHNYIEALYNRGVRNFVVSKPDMNCQDFEEAVFLLVPDTLRALQKLAAHQRNLFEIPVIGITGSNGKTITKEWIFQLLQEDFKIVRSPKSYNSQTGVPLSVWQLHAGTELAIFEAGISQPNEMDWLEKVIQPTIGIFTCIGDAHSENFIDQDQKIREKLKLFSHAEVMIYCADHEKIQQTISDLNQKCRQFSWGKHERNAVRLLDVVIDGNNARLHVAKNEHSHFFVIPFTDQASVENVMHAITLMFYLNISPEIMQNRLAKLESVAMRLEVKNAINEAILINDSYNSDLNSLGIALDFLVQQAEAKQLGKTLILSDIQQSKYNPEELYLKISGLVQARNIQKFIGVGEQISGHASLFQFTESHFFKSTDVLLHDELLESLHHEAILLKGSRSFQFELLSDKLALIAHETTLDVNLNALIENLNYFREGLKPGTAMMCMVKAFAYGSGSVETARILQHHRVNYLAVAVADEGAELRKSGINIPIAVMNPEKSAFNILIENQLEPEIYSFKLLHEFLDAMSKLGLANYPVHLKIDSGMHRLGFDPEDVPSLIDILMSNQTLKVKSVFSHLAGSDSPGLDYFTHQQARIFKTCADEIENALGYKITRHLLNSAGIERFPEYQFDMVRLGIGHYGISALPGKQLRQVCTLKTIILQLKNVKAGETVGYSRKWKLNKDKIIAVLPIGYADGFSRNLSNGVGEVYVNGKRAPVVGNVSMDLITIDVTGMKVKEGDPVEIFGENITIAEVAEKLNTIPYEILTGISRRVKRVYFLE